MYVMRASGLCPEYVVRPSGRSPCARAVLILLTFFTAAILRAHAAEIPFSDINIIDGDFEGASYVKAADLDGDGDLDVLDAPAALRNAAISDGIV